MQTLLNRFIPVHCFFTHLPFLQLLEDCWWLAIWHLTWRHFSPWTANYLLAMIWCVPLISCLQKRIT